MSFCPQCRSPLEPGARFCSNCGYTVPVAPAQPPGPRPFAGTPGFGGGPPQGAPPGYGPPPAQPGYGPPPAQPGYGPPQAPGYGPPPAQPGYGAPPQAPGYGAPPQAPGYGAPGYGAPPGPPGYGPMPVPPPAPEDDGGSMKVLGGCGLAGCLGAVAAVVVGLGLIVLLVMMAGSSSGGSTASGPSSGPGGEVPTEGSVRNLVRQRVGSYQLIGTTPLEKVPPGVVDSIGAVYSAPSGAKVIHVLLVYPTESIASDRIEAVFQSSLSGLKPGQKVSRGNVKDANGNIRGTIVGVTGGNPEAFYWNNRKLVVIVEGPPPHAKLFESNAPY